MELNWLNFWAYKELVVLIFLEAVALKVLGNWPAFPEFSRLPLLVPFEFFEIAHLKSGNRFAQSKTLTQSKAKYYDKTPGTILYYIYIKNHYRLQSNTLFVKMCYFDSISNKKFILSLINVLNLFLKDICVYEHTGDQCCEKYRPMLSSIFLSIFEEYFTWWIVYWQGDG